jgi:hypothetical protein
MDEAKLRELAAKLRIAMAGEFAAGDTFKPFEQVSRDIQEAWLCVARVAVQELRSSRVDAEGFSNRTKKRGSR